MSKSVAVIHSVGELVPVFKALCAEVIPDASCFHICDEGFVRTLTPDLEITTKTARRLGELVCRAEDDGADLILVTCSSIAPAVDQVRLLVEVPILKIDEPMADAAVQLGRRVGILATIPSALNAVSSLIRRRADAAGRDVGVEPFLLEGGLQMLQCGDLEGHDAMVVGGIGRLGVDCDVVVLAQGSMSRALEGLPDGERPCPVLTNARLGMARVAEMLKIEP